MSATLTPSPTTAADHPARASGTGPRPAELGTYHDQDGRPRALIARPGVGGSVLVIDQDAQTLTDRRLVAHLAADEPAVNARVVAERYLADDAGRRSRALEDRDSTTLPGGREPPDAPEPPAPGELRDPRGRGYRLAVVDHHRHGSQTRWLRRSGRHRPETVSLSTVIGALEAYEPARALTRAALNRAPNRREVYVLGRELDQLERSPLVLNRALRETVQRLVRGGELSLSCIAARSRSRRTGRWPTAAGGHRSNPRPSPPTRRRCSAPSPSPRTAARSTPRGTSGPPTPSPAPSAGIAPGGQIVEEVAMPEGLSVFACGLGGENGRTLVGCAAPDFDEGARAAALLATTVDVPRAGLR